MKIFVDFENAILNNSLNFEIFFAAFRKYGFCCFKHLKTFTLESLPYNPKTFSMLKDNYFCHPHEITVLYKPKNKLYAEMFFAQLKDEMPSLKILAINNKDKAKTIGSLEEFAYVGGTIKDWKLFRKATESCFVGNFFTIIFYWICVKKSKDSRVNLFNGFFSLFIRHFQIIFPIFAIWPAWIEVSDAVINLGKIKATFITSMGFMSFLSLLNSLGNLDKERAFFQKEITPLCAQEFISGSAKIGSAIVLSGIFFVFGIYGFWFNFLGGLSGIAFSLFFFIFRNSSFWRRWSFMLLVFFLINVGTNISFAKKLFKII